MRLRIGLGIGKWGNGEMGEWENGRKGK